MAQTILDLFPDAVSQFGLLGCSLAVADSVVVALCLLAITFRIKRALGGRQ